MNDSAASEFCKHKNDAIELYNKTNALKTNTTKTERMSNTDMQEYTTGLKSAVCFTLTLT